MSYQCGNHVRIIISPSPSQSSAHIEANANRNPRQDEEQDRDSKHLWTAIVSAHSGQAKLASRLAFGNSTLDYKVLIADSTDGGGPMFLLSSVLCSEIQTVVPLVRG